MQEDEKKLCTDLPGSFELDNLMPIFIDMNLLLGTVSSVLDENE